MAGLYAAKVQYGGGTDPAPAEADGQQAEFVVLLGILKTAGQNLQCHGVSFSALVSGKERFVFGQGF